jgi:Rrf2 family protein
MVTKTAELGIQALVFLARHGQDAPVSPKTLAGRFDESPTYMAKVTGHLVKADLLRAHRGPHGGVTLSRPPEAITLLEAVEAGQGKVLPDFCEDVGKRTGVCAYHAAMRELHESIVEVLGRWTIDDIAQKPLPAQGLRSKVRCRMACVEREAG